MTSLLSRRAALGVGVGTICCVARPSAAMARTSASGISIEEEIVRHYYRLWETRNWEPFDALLTSDFTFSSANGDDHIDKADYKKKCWDTQIDYIKSFDLEAVDTKPGEAFVKYLCHTRNGKQFRNVEYHRILDEKITSIECFFGGKSTFPSAASS